MEKLEYQVREIMTEKLHDQDEDGHYYDYFEEFDYDVIGNLYLDLTDEDLDDYDKVTQSVEQGLKVGGFISNKQKIIVEGDVIGLRVLSYNDFKPLFEIVLQ